MAIQLALRVTSLPLMVTVAAEIACEKLSRRGEWIANAAGVTALAVGCYLMAVSLGG